MLKSKSGLPTQSKDLGLIYINKLYIYFTFSFSGSTEFKDNFFYKIVIIYNWWTQNPLVNTLLPRSPL